MISVTKCFRSLSSISTKYGVINNKNKKIIRNVNGNLFVAVSPSGERMVLGPTDELCTEKDQTFSCSWLSPFFATSIKQFIQMQWAPIALQVVPRSVLEANFIVVWRHCEIPLPSYDGGDIRNVTDYFCSFTGYSVNTVVLRQCSYLKDLLRLAGSIRDVHSIKHDVNPSLQWYPRWSFRGGHKTGLTVFYLTAGWYRLWRSASFSIVRSSVFKYGRCVELWNCGW